MKSSLADLAVSGSGICLASSMIFVFGPGADWSESVLLVVALSAGAAFSCFGVTALRHLPSDPAEILGDDSMRSLGAAARGVWQRVHDLPWKSWMALGAIRAGITQAAVATVPAAAQDAPDIRTAA